MRIGIDIRAIGKKRTGDETVTKNLVQNLSKIDTKNKYCLFTDTNETKTIEESLSLENPNFKIVPVFPSNKLLWTFWSLPWALKKNPVDILHVQYITPQFLPKKTKLITTIHDISFVRFPKMINLLDRIIMKFFIPLSLKRADRIVTVSKFTKQELIDHYRTDKNKIVAIQNGGANKNFKREKDEQKKQTTLGKYNLQKPYLIYVGTHQPRKNIPFLIESFYDLLDQNPTVKSIQNLSLTIGGPKNGPNHDTQIDKIINKIKSKNSNIAEKIKIIGYVADKDLPILYQESSSAVFTSLYEGFGLPLIEAMASGAPVICNNGSSFEEVAANATISYKHNDKRDLGEKIAKLSNNKQLQEEMRNKGLKQATLFSWEKTAEETLDLYQKVYK